MYIPITEQEMAGLRILAQGRYQDKPYDRHMGNDGLEAHVLGLMGEYAVAKALNIMLDIAIYPRADDRRDLTLPDGRTLQVKYRERRTNDYALRSTDPAEFEADIGVLVCAARGGCEIVGVISREKFLLVAEVKDYGYGARLVAGPKHFTPLEKALGPQTARRVA